MLREHLLHLLPIEALVLAEPVVLPGDDGLDEVEDIIDGQLGDSASRFTRVGRGLIVNVDFVYFIDISKQRLILSDCLNCYHELSASREVLIKLKAYKEALRKYGL